MKICITGGLGYLGSRLTEALLSRGHEVSIVDSALYGNHLSSGTRNKIRIVNCNVLNPSKAAVDAVKDSDVVIHLAAIVGDQACDLRKSDAVDINLNGTRVIAKLCENFEKRMIYASTCSVYGASQKTLTEKSKVLPLSIYALTKYAGEKVLSESRVKYVILRMGTLFGFSPRMRFDLVVNTFVARALEHKEISVFGGSQFRPLLHVEDACDFYCAVIDQGFFGREIYNIGGINTKITDVALEVQRILGAQVRVIDELRDPRNYRVDSGHAIDTFKLHFKRDVAFGIEEMTRLIRQNGIENFEAPIYSNAERLRTLALTK